MMSWHSSIFIAVIVTVLLVESQQMRLPTKKPSLKLPRAPHNNIKDRRCKLNCMGEYQHCESQAKIYEAQVVCLLSRDLCNQRCKKIETLQKIANLLKSIHGS